MAEVGEIPWWRYAVGNDFYASRTSTTAYRRFDDAVNSHAAKIADEAFVANSLGLKKSLSLFRREVVFRQKDTHNRKAKAYDIKNKNPCTLHELNCIYPTHRSNSGSIAQESATVEDVGGLEHVHLLSLVVSVAATPALSVSCGDAGTEGQGPDDNVDNNIEG